MSTIDTEATPARATIRITVSGFSALSQNRANIYRQNSGARFKAVAEKQEKNVKDSSSFVSFDVM